MSKKALTLTTSIVLILTGCSLDIPDGLRCIDENGVVQTPTAILENSIINESYPQGMAEYSGSYQTVMDTMLKDNSCPTGYPVCLPFKNTYACSKCEKNMLNCGNGCIDVTNDSNNCGACGNACKNGVSCVNGICDDANGIKCPEHEAVFDKLCMCDSNRHWAGEPGNCFCMTGYVEINNSCEEIVTCSEHPGQMYVSETNQCVCNALDGWVNDEAETCSCNTDKGWKNADNNACVCDEYKVNNGTDTCSCDSTLHRVDNGSGTCVCDAANLWIEEDGVCSCGSNSHKADDGTGKCACDYRNGWVEGNDGVCICDPAKKRIEENGECICGKNKVGDSAGICTCDASKHWKDDGNGSCICDPDKNRIEENGECVCGKNKVGDSDGICTCDASKHWKDDGNGSCICDAEHKVDDGSGVCACDTANHWVEGSDGCVCADGYYFASNGNCVPLPVVGGTIVLGQWTYNDKTQPVEWIVLDEKDDNYLVLSKDILDEGKFYDEPTGHTWLWSESTTKAWCNSFYSRAFNEEEMARVLKLNLETDRYYYSDSKANNPCNEYNMCINGTCNSCSGAENCLCDQVNVFILSAYEAAKYSNYTKLSDCPNGWWVRVMYDKTTNDKDETVRRLSYVTANGTIINASSSQSLKGMRPAMWVHF